MSDPTKVTIEVAAFPVGRAVLAARAVKRPDGSFSLIHTAFANLDAGEPQTFEIKSDEVLVLIPERGETEPF